MVLDSYSPFPEDEPPKMITDSRSRTRSASVNSDTIPLNRLRLDKKAVDSRHKDRNQRRSQSKRSERRNRSRSRRRQKSRSKSRRNRSRNRKNRRKKKRRSLSLELDADGYGKVKSRHNRLLRDTPTNLARSKNLKFDHVRNHRDRRNSRFNSADSDHRRDNRRRNARFTEPKDRRFFSHISAEFQQLPVEHETTKQSLETLLHDLLAKQHGRQSHFHKNYFQNVLETKRSLVDQHQSLYDQLEYRAPETAHKIPGTDKFELAASSIEENILQFLRDPKLKEAVASPTFDDQEMKLFLELKHFTYQMKSLKNASPGFIRSVFHLCLVQQVSLDLLKRFLYLFENILCKNAPIDCGTCISLLLNAVKQASHMTAQHLPKNAPILKVQHLQQQFDLIRATSATDTVIAANNPLLASGRIRTKSFSSNTTSAQKELTNFSKKLCPLCGSKPSNSNSGYPSKPRTNLNNDLKTPGQMLSALATKNGPEK